MMALHAGRTPREEKDAQGPCEEEDNIHEAIRQRYYDWWKEEGELAIPYMRFCDLVDDGVVGVA